MTDDGITLRGTRFVVSASGKISTGDYENYNPHITVEGKIPTAVKTAIRRSTEEVSVS